MAICDSSAQAGALESTAKEKGRQREVKQTFKMLREVWLNIGVEKIDTHEGVAVKALLDSGAIGMFMDKMTVAKHGFMLQKLERPIMVRNVDGTNNSGGAITHQIEANVYYKGHCYESPKQEKVSHAFEHLIQNLKAYNGVRI